MLKFKMKKACIAMAALVLLVPQVGVVSAHAEEVPTETEIDEYSVSLLRAPVIADGDDEVEGWATAGGMEFKYVIGVDRYIAYVRVSTMDYSDICIRGTAYDSWNYPFPFYNAVDQRMYADVSVRDSSWNQMCVVDYSIRVDGPDGGTNVSKRQPFAEMKY